MDVHSHVMFKVFSSGGDIQYVLPHFQREYAWEKPNWQTLLNDIWGIYEIYDEDSPPEHFLGALVVIKDGMRNGIIPAFKLVDGQQRLTTISILLCALAKLVVDTNPNLHRKLRKLITNPDEEGLLHYKLIPTKKYGDQETYINLINGDTVSNGHLSKIPDAFNYIYGQLEYTTVNRSGIVPERLFLVIANCMHVVFIDLDQKERPFEIFESLNAKGNL